MYYSAALFSAFLLLEASASFWGSNPATIVKIKLTESTRGTYRFIEVTPNNRTILFNEEKESLPVKSGAWARLTKEATKLSIKELDQIVVTSKRHQVDAALHATITIITTEGRYTTSTFDHNAPPEELLALKACLYRQIPPKMRDRFH